MRYTTTAQLVKLNVNYTISRLLLRISDIKRSKMVKTINIYYNNKPVPSVVELKNKPNIWQKAKRVNLTPSQTDIKIDFTLPIVAYNLMIEYADFYDNLQLSAETLQCPRCSASVPANPGVCANCGENVYQCHKCRAINYDERDPFLCTSCGFCKYAKFEYTLVTKPCYAVEPVQDESERQKALNSVINLLEQADKIYQQLTNQKQALEMLLRTDDSTFSSRISTTTLSGSAVASPSGGMSPVNKSIQSLAQKYCTECKASFEDLSKIIQKVTVTRKELLNYDQRQQDSVYLAVVASPAASPISPGSMPTFKSSFSASSDIVWTHEDASTSGKDLPPVLVKCYGCALSTVEHCLTILKAFATVKGTHEVMLKQGLLNQLLDHNLQQRKPQVVTLARTLIIMLTKDNSSATNELNRIISKQIQVCLESKAANITSVISLSNQMSVLGQSLNSYDSCWEQRLKCIFQLFLDSVQRANVDVMDTMTLPCLKILSKSMKQGVVVSDDKDLQEMPVLSLVSEVKAANWLNGDSDYSYANWCSKTGNSSREIYLTRKYVSIWKENMKGKKTERKEQVNGLMAEKIEEKDENSIDGDTWLRLLLFTPSSKAVRQTTCSVLENLCQTPTKKEKLLHLFSRYLENLHTAGENAADFLGLYKVLLKSPEWKIYFASYGILDKLFNLIIKEVDFLSVLESTTFTFDLSQGYALHSLTEILKIFFEDDKVKSMYKSRFVGNVLHCYLSLRRLVVQRTKLIDTTEDILLSLLEQLTSGTEAEERSFMAICVDALRRCAIGDIRTPVFIYERLCNIIHKEEKEVKEFFIIIEKDPQQEDFLQGRMQGNPYSCKEVGLGPLMRDIKNKICTECELIALLDDDTGMELLVNNKIISLDLPVADVFKKIWCVKGERQDPMKIVYRMRGLLGDATEDMINSLDNDKDKDVDEEYEYRLAAVIAEVGGLDVILKRLACVRDLSRTEQLVSVVLKLLEYCVKVKVNRQYLSKPSSNALNVLLATLNLALRLEKDLGSKSGGAVIAERLLNIMGIILHEASAAHTEHYKLSVLPGEESQLELLLGHITSPYVRSNPSVLQAMMRLIPFLSFGIEKSMKTLIEHFMPYLDFERFDDERSPDETLYLDCFCVIALGISKTGIGSRLKDLINDSNITSRALEYLRKHTPPKTFSASGILDTTKWKEFLARPSLPYVLRLLTGLTAGHSGTQVLVGTEENVAVLHRLEQVSSEEMVGSLAENLMEELREHTDTKTKVIAVRRDTRNEKKKMALAMRQKQLEALGMEVTVAGQIKAKPTAVIKEMEELLEEKGLVCCICREGYKFHPTKVLGIYTYTTRCVLDEFENRPRKTQGYTTVSTFNVIHFDCHSEAIRHARSRDEWESAALQNANTKCNGLMPIWGPKVSESAFATCLARHNNYLQECTGFREPTFHSTVHDLRLTLQRFAHEKSFNDESGGGGRISNMYLIPYMAHIALYVLNTTRLHSTEEKLLTTFLVSPKTKWIEAAYETDGTLFMTVLSIFILPLKQWKEKRTIMLQQLIVLAHARKLSATGLKKLEDVELKEYKVYKPLLLFFALVDNFHEIFKGNLGSNEEDWGQVMSTYMRNNDEALLKGTDKLLSLYENDLLPCESFAEFCDVAGLSEDIQDPDQFLKNTLDTTKADE